MSSSVAEYYQAQQFYVQEIMDDEALWTSKTPRAIALLQHLRDLESPNALGIHCPYPRDTAAPRAGPRDAPAAKRRKTEAGYVVHILQASVQEHSYPAARQDSNRLETLPGFGRV